MMGFMLAVVAVFLPAFGVPQPVYWTCVGLGVFMFILVFVVVG
jgi:hypothetical protein